VSSPGAVLEQVCKVRGLRGAVLVSAADGLVVAESLMDDVDGRALAALAASLASRLTRAVLAAGRSNPAFVQLAAERGSVLATPAGEDLIIVAVAGPDANIGLARLELLAAARSLR
jgi:predicted regulator of Ras-like GTPase activity (Roadblock/LC7/MglB family)